MEDLEDDVDPNILLDYFTFSNIPRRSGRKPSYDTWVRSLFVRNKIRNHPKKEYIRCQLIRGHKRINRNILKGKNPNKTINTLNHSNKESIDAFKDLTDVFWKHPEHLTKISQTEEGPETDGKNKRREKSSSKNRSFNHIFCKKYFDDFSVRESYYYYINYLFADFDPNSLCKKFGFRCCMMGDQHTKHCHQKWDILKNYVAFEMLNDIGIEPYFVTSGIQFSHLSGINQHIAQILSMGDRFANFIHQEMPEVVKTQIDEFARTHSSVDGVFISTE